MNVDFGKPFNGILAKVSIIGGVIAWGTSCGYIVYLGLEFDRSPIKTAGLLLLLVLMIIPIFYSSRNMWLNPKFRITSEEFLARDVGPTWRMTKYELKNISSVRGHALPYVSFKHDGKKIFLYVPLMGKNERARLVNELRQAASRSFN